MTILALDTSSRRRGLCVLAAEDGTLLDHRALTGRHLDRELPPALSALLGDDLGAVACVLGPGSYTGLRVGIAATLGLAHARDLPLHGIGALEVVALAAPESAIEVEAVADAGRGALYVARYRRAGGAVECTAEPRRVETAGWSPAPGATAVALDAVDGAVDAADRAAVALAAAAAASLSRPPLPRAGLAPIYLHGDGSAPGHPRV
jgi:tRNA threonylcarbamoyladenosine biosynthesis protein TsaB